MLAASWYSVHNVGPTLLASQHAEQVVSFVCGSVMSQGKQPGQYLKVQLAISI
jgi:hypothetical protein